MPIYDYICKDCGLEQTHLIMHTGESIKCNKCESERLEKQLVKETSHVLKGRGWYKDGYGSSDGE